MCKSAYYLQALRIYVHDAMGLTQKNQICLLKNRARPPGTMSDEEEYVREVHSDDELDNPLRVIMVINSPDHPDGDMEERLLDTIQSFKDMNLFFDKFDETIAIPNEGHIKYEVGSDGLVVIVVDSMELRTSALKFLDDWVSEDSTTGDGPAKKKKTV